jgi:hypothetical protein
MVRREKNWMEQELEQSLRRVAAPQELWGRIQNPEQGRARSRTRLVAWAAVPALMFLTLWGSHPKTNPALQFQSSDPGQIQAWVKANTGLDVPLHAGNLVGAKRASAQAAEIAYQAGGHDLSLIVSGKAAPARHEASAISWTAGGQLYLLASAEPQYLKSCVVCHVGS